VAQKYGIIYAMRKIGIALFAVLLALAGNSEPVCVNGVCYPDEEAARAAGALRDDALPDFKSLLGPADDEKPAEMNRRLAMGYMAPREFKAFLAGAEDSSESLAKEPVAMVFLLVLLGGLLMNLTPCVLPLVPVSLALVGRGVARGTAYGLGMTLAYGALGVATAFGGLAFGAIQSSPWFNVAVAVVFMLLGLATSEVFFIDFSRFRPRPKAGGDAAKRGLLGPFLLGSGTAVLAGACVAPILLATLVLTAKWFAAGRVWAVALPFVLGAGMGLPWPFITAGMSVLPKPGAWMRWVNRVFAVVLFCLAAWYGWLAWEGFTARSETTPPPTQEKVAVNAADSTRPTLVIVGAPWCKNCTAMEKSTLKEKSVVEALARFNVKHIEINTFDDLEKHPELSGLDIKGVPAYVVIEAEKKE